MGEPPAAMSSTTPLSSIIELCQSLHGSKGTAALSLQQLVPVHASIIQARRTVSSMDQHSNEPIDSVLPPSTDIAVSLQAALESFRLTESERAVCKSILSADNEAAKLLVLQYLLTSVCRDECLLGLTRVVLPFLLDASSSYVSDELTEAVLHALFSAGKLSVATANDTAQFTQCLECLEQDTVDPKGIRQKRGCRVLERLVVAFADDVALETVLTTVTQKIVQGVNYAVSKPEEMAVTLRPITTDLLPLVVNPKASPTHVERIWTTVWKHYSTLMQQQQQDSKGSISSVMTVVTTVLCTIVPSLLDRELPRVDSSESGAGAQPSRLLDQPAIWELILLCLSQGIQVPKKASWVEDSWKSQAAVEDTTASSQLLRRRGLYLLRITTTRGDYLNWQKYVACFETLEMEFEPHLVDQVWETVAELCSQISDVSALSTQVPPPLSWSWMSVLLARIMSSYEAPILRKLGLFRLFKGQAGIIVDSVSTDDASAASSRKKKTRNTQSKPTTQRGASLRIVSADFVLGVVVPSFDSLVSSVGTVMHLEENRKIVREDMSPLLSNFLGAYLQVLADEPEQLQAFYRKLWSPDIICKLHRKTTVHIFTCIADILKKRKELSVAVEEEALKTLVQSFQVLLSLGSVIIVYREALLEALATMLAHSQAAGSVTPLTILSVLSLFPFPTLPEGGTLSSAKSTESSWVENDTTFAALRQWLVRLGQGTPSWACNVGAAVAVAFVDGFLFRSSSASIGDDWDPVTSTTTLERDTGKAISFFCTLSINEADGAAIAASELLWPAIHKGISYAPTAMTRALMGSSWLKADRVTRALLLLENGCKLQVLSGMGNGDLLVDRKTQQMMPPPPNIENMLAHGVNFVMGHVHALLSGKDLSNGSAGGCSRSDDAKRVSQTFAGLISLLQTLHEAFPSSMAVSNAVNGLLEESIESLSSNDHTTGGNRVQRIALVYATLTCGAELDESTLLSMSRMLLGLHFSETGGTARDEQSSRSVYQYAKWGALSSLLPRLMETSVLDLSDVQSFVDKVFVETCDAVEATPFNALLPLFRCVVVAARGRFSPQSGKGVVIDKANLRHLEKVVRALFSLMADCKNSVDSMYMLEEISALLFQPSLLLDESARLTEDPDCLAPLRDAFRELMKFAGRRRPHVSRAVLCRISSSWLGMERGVDAGISAIPYRDDIADLLLYKEEDIDEGSANQSVRRNEKAPGTLDLPAGTHELSVARAFVLVFVSKLPTVNEGLQSRVLSDLLHHLIFRLLDDVCSPGGDMVMVGTAGYCLKMRGWQALCILSRFITHDIAERVCTRVYEALAEPLHGQIRYFIEVCTLQCARMHPAVFGNELVVQITRRDLTLQKISSLMIVGGNLIVGRYEIDFFRQYDAQGGDAAVRLNLVLAGVIPWLGSTQGFSRAIAQLLVHKLIPLVIDIEKPSSGPGTEDNDWYLRSLYSFLEENSEMKRLRKKQSKFFSRYDVDPVCTAEGVLSIPVDEESGEADPLHMVEAIKECLKDVYEEAHAREEPTWKQIENILNEQKVESKPLTTEASDVVNFQRKIIPLDALNLVLEEMREKRLRNAAGRKKQQLIVCASLVDKAPNLGGLARTSEIFAADRLVIPDIRVTKMDNFKSLSVGAGDWIEIEECTEEVSHCVCVAFVFETLPNDDCHLPRSVLSTS